MMETYELLARDSDRRLTVVATDDSAVTADPRYLRQMLHNLLTNALRHGKGAIFVTIGRDGTDLVCRVSNAVSGASAAPGTGLGLRIVRVLAGLHPKLAFKSDVVAGRFTAELRWV